MRRRDTDSDRNKTLVGHVTLYDRVKECGIPHCPKDAVHPEAGEGYNNG